jgi:hypothetical protein
MIRRSHWVLVSFVRIVYVAELLNSTVQLETKEVVVGLL